MAGIITLLLLGIGSGSLVALSALGLVLMYRSSGVVNFSTGAIGMVCSFVMWDLTRNAGWAAFPASVFAVLFGAILGAISYVLVMVLPRRNSNVTRVIGTLAILSILEAAAQLRYGTDAEAVKAFLPTGSVNFGGGIAVPTSQIILAGVALALTVVLARIYAGTTFGLATTAVSERPRTLAAFGWRIGAMGSVNWAIGGALAGLAGVLLAPLTGVSISNGNVLTVAVLAAALIGGMRSFPLTLVGGVVLGMLQSLFSIHDLGIPGLADALPFAAIIGVIAVRGRNLPLRSFIGDRLPRVGTGVPRPGAILFGLALVVVLIGFVLNPNGVAGLTTTMLTAISLLSLTVLLGFAGQMSLAQFTLAGVGGLIAAQLAGNAGFPFLLALPLAVLGTIPVGLIVGLPSARTRGVSLAVATLGLAVAIQALVFGNDSLAGGINGISLSSDGSFNILGTDFDSFLHPDRFAFLVLGFIFVLCLIVANLRRGASGRRMIAVRGNERAAAGLGVNVVTTKLWAFALAAAITAVGGVLTVFESPTAVFTGTSILSNISYVGYSVVGGAGSVLGALFGGTLDPNGVGSGLLGTLFGIGPVTVALLAGVILLFNIIAAPDGLATMSAAQFSAMREKIVEVVFKRPGRAEAGVLAYLARGSAESRRARAATLKLNSVGVTFGQVRAVDAVDLQVEPGEVVGVIGANGAGKTTLIDAITGFVGSRGAIELGGEDVSSLPAHGRARAGIARSWQTLELIEDLSVLDNLRTAADSTRWWSVLLDLLRPNRGRPTAAMLGAIEALGLDQYLSRVPSELTTGQRKLVALARAMASEPSVLLLDEPCSGLDQHEREEVGRVIRMLAESWGMGVLLVEHDIHLVRRVADRVVAMDAGRVISRGTPDQVLTDPRVMAAFLGEVAPADESAALS
jgi:ABC-type branched-subunit amino acid transport system ATPase component/branched-subunit amino acid ABC-type transport system permease component